MSDSSAAMRGQIASATDLQSMARTMKTVAAANIGQYDSAVAALDRYYDVVQDGLSVCLRAQAGHGAVAALADGPAGAIVFGSDQGLVGQFNDIISAHALGGADAPAKLARVWPVGERVALALADGGARLGPAYALPSAIDAVTALVGQLLVEIEACRERGEITQVYVFHHRSLGGAAYEPACVRLLPLDRDWESRLAARRWPGTALPQVMPAGPSMLAAGIREYLFVSLYRACAQSLAAENAARLAAMQRAEKNIGELLQQLTQTYHRLRQGSIDEELFDLVAGFEAQRGR